ncbi:MAG: flagellar hook capping FlgD N-terminal domain-containing protein [Planctomycetaceae bacterium]
MATALSAASTAGIASKDQFLTLFAKQLQYQDPTSPTDTDAFLAQLAQFTTVEGIQNMNSGITGLGTKLDTLIEASSSKDDLQTLEAINAGANLLGLSVRYGEGASDTGIVSEIKPDDGQILVRIGNNLYPISDVTGVAYGNQNLTP